MNNCPFCSTPVSFQTEEDWYACHACQGLVRLHTPPGGIRRVEAGAQTADQIVPVQLPEGSRPVDPRPGAQPKPAATRPVQLRSTTPPTAPVRNAGIPQVSISSTNPNSMSLEQVRAERQLIAAEVRAVDARNESLVEEMRQYARNPERLAVLSGEVSRESQRRRELLRRDERLRASESLQAAKQSAQRFEATTQRVMNPRMKEGDPRMGCGISAFAGAIGIIGFTLYMGISQWDPKTLGIMLGVGVGIAFVGWLSGRHF